MHKSRRHKAPRFYNLRTKTLRREKPMLQTSHLTGNDLMMQQGLGTCRSDTFNVTKMSTDTDLLARPHARCHIWGID
jgi:hypothetical protein